MLVILVLVNILFVFVYRWQRYFDVPGTTSVLHSPTRLAGILILCVCGWVGGYVYLNTFPHKTKVCFIVSKNTTGPPNTTQHNTTTETTLTNSHHHAELRSCRNQVLEGKKETITKTSVFIGFSCSVEEMHVCVCVCSHTRTHAHEHEHEHKHKQVDDTFTITHRLHVCFCLINCRSSNTKHNRT